MDAKSGIPNISMPKGGGAIKGIGETFQATPFTGTASFSVPLPTPKSRGLEPDLSLTYSSGGAQGEFGMGFSLSVPQIARRTEKRLPNYSEVDEFVLSSAEYLIPALKLNGDVWESDEVNLDGVRIRRFRTRTEGRFLRIEQWTKPDGDSHWRVTTPENLTSIYGQSAIARIVHPDHPQQVFAWLLEETFDAVGNRIQYIYTAEDGTGIEGGSVRLSELSRQHKTQKYLTQIRYGNYVDDQNQTQWAFNIILDYGNDNETDFKVLTTNPTDRWTLRPDPFSDYRAGFEVRTHRLCQRILVFHHFPLELGFEHCLVHATQLTYRYTSSLSFLSQVDSIGYQRQPDGSYRTQALPPLTLDYSDYDPQGQMVRPLSVASQQSLATTFDEPGYQFLDLYGEGIAGLLYDHHGTTLYWRPQGAGQYALPHEPVAFPSNRNQPDADYAIADGITTWLTFRTPTLSGQFTLETETHWNSFAPFEGLPLDILDSEVEFTDVTGDGRADVLVFEEDRVKVYPSAGSQGHHPGIVALRSPDLPMRETPTLEEDLVFADMVGDGLSDRVRIRNGEVSYWPNLGYGKFGHRVVMENAPHFGEQVNVQRLFLVDIDGTGTADIVYVQPQELHIYFNQTGNRFSDPVIVPLPAPYSDLSQIQFVDVQGNGTNCLVFTYGTDKTYHVFYDFTGGIKPHLLTSVDNHMGATYQIQYGTSTQFYLADQWAGRPWLTRLPFPVQVVERTEIIDHIAQSRRVSRYAYHHGAFDVEEREFAGFGLVEQWDTETFTSDTSADEAQTTGLEPEQYVRPTHTKTWFHTGLAGREGSLSKQFEAEYYAGDTHAINMADSSFDDPAIDPGSLREAYRALRGRVLREEVYGNDDTPAQSHPYTVTDYRYSLRLVQPIEQQRYSVYLSLLREVLTYHYERNPKDPRILHQFHLEYDPYGKLTRSIDMAYGRRSPAPDLSPTVDIHADQRHAQGIYTYRRYGHLDTKTDYRLGVLVEKQILELDQSSLPDQPDATITWQTMAWRYHQPERIARDSDGRLSADPAHGQTTTLQHWERHIYWEPDQKIALPHGVMTRHGLLYRLETAVYTPAMISDGLQGILSAVTGASDRPALDDLTLEGGDLEALNRRISATLVSTRDSDGGAFTQRTINNREYYWDLGEVVEYHGSEHFYQPQVSIDQFGTRTELFYDRYDLSVVRTEAVLDADRNERLVRRSEIDYQARQPKAVIDVNQNVTEYEYTPLGYIWRMSHYGKEGDTLRGDRPLTDVPRAMPPDGAIPLARLLASPETYLGDSRMVIYYDLQSWMRSQQPVHGVRLESMRYQSDRQNNDPTDIQIQISYADGLGRNVQVKQWTEGDRWLTSGHTVYNNKGLVVKQYEPYYTDTPDYQITDVGVTPIYFYDPLGRVDRVDLPKGYRTRTEYTAWGHRQFDANDLIRESPYYQTRSQLDDNDRNALAKAETHSNTPTETWFDGFGRPFLIRKWLGEAIAPLDTYTQLTALGYAVHISDPRAIALGRASATLRYDLLGREFYQDNTDSGTSMTLYNVGGDPIHRWDGRGFHVSKHYDALSRPIETRVEGNGLNHQVERLIYGEFNDPEGDRNLRGQVISYADQGGISTFDRYSIDGQWLRTTRRLRRNFRGEPNWAENEPVNDEAFVIEQRFNALGQLERKTYPDGQQVHYDYHISGRLKSQAVEEGNRAVVRMDDVQYNARNQRLSTQYGNGIETQYTYDPETFRLNRLISQRPNGDRLQDITYTYDPMGNPTRIEDATYRTVVTNNRVVSPRQDYTYDALYRLIRAEGREHAGLRGRNYRTHGLPDYAQALTVPPNQNDMQALQPYVRQFTYDASGNLTQIKHDCDRNPFVRTIAIAEQSNHAIVEERPGVDPSTFYDASGNLTRMLHLDSMTWNYENQLMEAVVVNRPNDNNDDAEYYTYDGAGHRLLKVSMRMVNGRMNREETLYLGDYEVHRTYVGDRQVEERIDLALVVDGERVATAYRWPQKRTEDTPDRQVRYQLTNHQGSVSLEVDDRSQIISYEEYYPYGGVSLLASRNQREVSLKRYRYSGRERDSLTQFDYYGARYYVPWMGRWLSPDPAGTVDGVNLYVFAGNNPIRYGDDGGLLLEPTELDKILMSLELASRFRQILGLGKGKPLVKQNPTRLARQLLAIFATASAMRSRRLPARPRPLAIAAPNPASSPTRSRANARAGNNNNAGAGNNANNPAANNAGGNAGNAGGNAGNAGNPGRPRAIANAGLNPPGAGGQPQPGGNGAPANGGGGGGGGGGAPPSGNPLPQGYRDTKGMVSVNGDEKQLVAFAAAVMFALDLMINHANDLKLVGQGSSPDDAKYTADQKTLQAVADRVNPQVGNFINPPDDDSSQGANAASGAGDDDDDDSSISQSESDDDDSISFDSDDDSDDSVNVANPNQQAIRASMSRSESQSS